MDLEFSVGKGITMDFSIGGGAPVPAPVAVYGSWIGVADPCLMGFVTDNFEEVQDGD